ncbi:MAG: hypothetical protein ACREYF_26410 [Gammaproteobacteria bacterium]
MRSFSHGQQAQGDVDRGVPPLGYGARNPRLVVNEMDPRSSAKSFPARFVELGSSTLPVKELRLDSITSKAWTTQDGQVRQGKPIHTRLI